MKMHPGSSDTSLVFATWPVWQANSQIANAHTISDTVSDPSRVVTRGPLGYFIVQSGDAFGPSLWSVSFSG